MSNQTTEYVKCPRCGNEMPKGSAFCSACGSKIEEPKIEFISCKYCSNMTPKESLYCMHCGSALVKLNKKQDAKEVSIPEPKQLPSGKWFIYLRMKDHSYPITKDKREECIATALAIKQGLIEGMQPNRKTLKKACEEYIAKRENICSESTLAGYECITRSRFQKYMNMRIDSIDWQTMVNEESEIVSAKTIDNAWGFVRTVTQRIKVPAYCRTTAN